jgi:hypothetical protein
MSKSSPSWLQKAGRHDGLQLRVTGQLASTTRQTIINGRWGISDYSQPTEGPSPYARGGHNCQTPCVPSIVMMFDQSQEPRYDFASSRPSSSSPRVHDRHRVVRRGWHLTTRAPEALQSGEPSACLSQHVSGTTSPRRRVSSADGSATCRPSEQKSYSFSSAAPMQRARLGENQMLDVGLLMISAAVFHSVPARNTFEQDGSPSVPVLSTAESKLDGQLEFFLRDRLTRTFAQAAQPVREDPDSIAPTPDLVVAALTGQSPADIVRPFHPLPDLLLDAQAHNSPKGLLAVIRGKCGATPVLVIVKVEQERGLSFETHTENGITRVEVVIEDGLVFTDKTEVFKAAIFYMDGSDLAGFVTDDQSGSIYSGPSSRYWLSDFLGCRFSNDLDVMTRSWIKATKRLIKSDIADAARKSAVLSAMLAELSSNRSNIHPKQFIQNYVPEDLQDQALSRLRAAGAPVTSFPKSRDVASKAPGRKRIIFDTGYEVVMPAEMQPDIRKELLDGMEVDVLTIRGVIKRVDT